MLRRPTPQILSRFAAGGPRLIMTWYLFALSTALIIPGVILLSEVAGSRALARIALPIGVFGGAVQLVGLIRWPFLVPYLARRYASPDASAATREAMEITFESAHRFLGLAVGEHLGYLSTAVWTALIAFALVSAGVVLPPAAYLGLLTAVGIAAGLLEPAGWRLATTVNAIAYLLWSVWLTVVGVALLST